MTQFSRTIKNSLYVYLIINQPSGYLIYVQTTDDDHSTYSE